MKNISNSDNLIDSRNIIARISGLEDDLGATHSFEVMDRITELEKQEELDESDQAELDELKSLKDFDTWLEQSDDPDAEELKALKAFAEEAEDYSQDWKYGATLIRESWFTEYCQQLCEDIGDLPKNIPNYIVIDWDSTADNLRADYTEVDFDGETYLVR